MATGVGRTEIPFIVIVGPTASGKTSLAVELAEEHNGEIICADSRTVYKDMDIGTAKPDKHERQRVPHWGLDLVYPDQVFTVSDFKQYADQKIADIRSRGKIPFLVGGSGLYIDAVIFEYQFGAKADNTRRKQLESLSLSELQKHCNDNNIPLPQNRDNKRYVIRAIERNGSGAKRRQSLVNDCIVVGIATEKIILRNRIADRCEQLFTKYVVEEAILLDKKYGWESEAMTGNIYPLIRSYLKRENSLDAVKEKFKVLDWKLAKRQLTWFRSNPHIVWVSSDEAVSYLKEVLAVS